MKFKKPTYFLFLVLFLISITPISAAETLGVFEQNKDVSLLQTCDNCTYVNLTSVQYPNSSITIIGVNMTNNGNIYNYTFSTTSDIGTYIYTTCGDVDGVLTCANVDFEITRTGEKVSLSNSIMVIAFLILAIICLVLGHNFAMEHWLIKTFFYFCSVLSGILAINTARIIASESSSLSTMGSAGLLIGVTLFAVFFIVMFVFTFIEIVKAMREKRGVRWDYDL